jgi:hypothetical protein
MVSREARSKVRSRKSSRMTQTSRGVILGSTRSRGIMSANVGAFRPCGLDCRGGRAGHTVDPISPSGRRPRVPEEPSPRRSLSPEVFPSPCVRTEALGRPAVECGDSRLRQCTDSNRSIDDHDLRLSFKKEPNVRPFFREAMACSTCIASPITHSIQTRSRQIHFVQIDIQIDVLALCEAPINASLSENP